MIINEVTEITEQEIQNIKGYILLFGIFSIGVLMGRGSINSKMKEAYLRGILDGLTSAKMLKTLDKK
jgi:hypothetical protein